jgi:CBS domain-containing protein
MRSNPFVQSALPQVMLYPFAGRTEEIVVPVPFTSMEQLMPFPTAEELLSNKKDAVVSVPPQTTVLEAMRLMADKDIGFLPVIENGTLAGVLSERDCARRMVLQQLAAATTTVREIMTTHVHSVPPQCKIPECIMLMHAKGIRHLPVVSRNAVIGVLSVRDLMGALIERHERLLRRFSEERLTLLYPSPSSY